MATTPPSTFWTDLNRRLEDPEFRRAYIATSLTIQAVDAYVNATERMPLRRAHREMRKARPGWPRLR